LDDPETIYGSTPAPYPTAQPEGPQTPMSDSFTDDLSGHLSRTSCS